MKVFSYIIDYILPDRCKKKRITMGNANSNTMSVSLTKRLGMKSNVNR